MVFIIQQLLIALPPSLSPREPTHCLKALAWFHGRHDGQKLNEDDAYNRLHYLSGGSSANVNVYLD